MSRIYMRYKEQIGDYLVVVSIKDVKRLRLRVEDNGDVGLTVPLSMRNSYRNFVIKNHDWIAKSKEKANIRREMHPKPTTELLKSFYNQLPMVFDRWETAMGLRTSSVNVKMMKSRWGSCNPVTGAITINFRLALYPPECLDYVVIHELAHLIHPNHSRDFWNLVECFCPHYKSIKKRLRE